MTQTVTVIHLAFYGIRSDDPRINKLIALIDQWEDDHGIEGSSISTEMYTVSTTARDDERAT